MKRWPKMFGAQIVAAVLSFSLLSYSHGQSDLWQNAIENAKHAQDSDDIRQVKSDLQKAGKLDQNLADYLNSLADNDVEITPEVRNDLTKRLELRQFVNQGNDTKDNSKDQAKAIKSSNPMFRDKGTTEGSNWMAKSFERMGDIFRGNQTAKPQNSSTKAPDLGLVGIVLVYGVIILLAGMLLYFIYLATRHFRWKINLKRKARALLEEDEPERTLDEWLQMADQLAGQGKYREAVRCLYLACLLKFDEHGIARFDRGQTNWEHLARIRSSPNMPPNLDFEQATQMFDRVWYGYKGEGLADVARFRTWYEEITEVLRASKAA